VTTNIDGNPTHLRLITDVPLEGGGSKPRKVEGRSGVAQWRWEDEFAPETFAKVTTYLKDAPQYSRLYNHVSGSL